MRQHGRRLALRKGVEREKARVTRCAGSIGTALQALLAWRPRDKVGVGLQRQRRTNEADRRVLERQVKERTATLASMSRSLALSEARLRGIFDSAPDAILTANAQQEIVAANASAGRLFRCPAETLIGLPLEHLIPSRYRHAHRRDVQAFGQDADHARRMGRAQEVVGLRTDGEEFPIDAAISHLEVGGDRLYTVILRDITQRREIEQALQESRARLDAALASMNDGVAIADIEGRLVDFNDAFIAFHRLRRRDVCRATLAEYANFLDVSLEDGTPAPLEQWAVPRALRGEAASNVDYVLRRKDTGEAWVGNCSFAPIRSGAGHIIGAVVTYRDVTQARNAQAALAASHAELQRLVANQHRIQEDERKRIARELHDDLQQPLAAIRMDVAALAETLDGRTDEAGPLLRRIDSFTAAAIASSRRIVRDLRPEMLEELGLVAALEAMCMQHERRTGVPCSLVVEPCTEDMAIDNAPLSTALYRITQEALNNAAKHAKATAVSVQLDCRHAGLVTLRISDDGVGIGPEWRGTRRPGSFGLRGMAERVRALGGQLRIGDRAGSGTTIEVLVPSAAPAAESATPPAPAVPVAASLEGWGQNLQTVIDSLEGSVAVLDTSGTIRLVNRTWHRFSGRPEDTPLGCGPGVNYLQVCRRSAQTDASVIPILKGIEQVLAGLQSAFGAEYPCDFPDGRRWFRLHVASITGGLSIVSHVDLTREAELPRASSTAEAQSWQHTVAR